MSLDQTLAVSGSVLGAIGLVVTVAARVRAAADAGSQPVPATHGAGSTALFPTAEAAAPESARRTGRGFRRRSRRDERSNAELDDELVTTTVLGWFVLWLLAVAALYRVHTEVAVLQIMAEVAITVSVFAIGFVGYELARRRGRHAGWMIDLFVATTALAAVPLWFHQPRFGQGRFDRLDDWLPDSGSIDVRLDDTLKDYGPGIVAHVLVQAAGIAALVAMALYVVATIVRRARGRYGHQPLDRWVSLSALAATLVGAVCACGAAVSVPTRALGSSSFTTASAGASVGDGAPALALRADRRGRVSLLFARCGDDRILAVQIDQRAVLSPTAVTDLTLPVGGGVTAVPVPPGTGPVRIVLRSTRRYRTTVTFPRRPRANHFLPLRTADTLATFYRRGHGC